MKSIIATLGLVVGSVASVASANCVDYTKRDAVFKQLGKSGYGCFEQKTDGWRYEEQLFRCYTVLGGNAPNLTVKVTLEYDGRCIAAKEVIVTEDPVF